MGLDDLKDALSQTAHGMTKGEAHEKGVCIGCKQPWEPKTHSELGRREYQISAMCEECFDTLFGEPVDVDEDLGFVEREDEDANPSYYDGDDRLDEDDGPAF